MPSPTRLPLAALAASLVLVTAIGSPGRLAAADEPAPAAATPPADPVLADVVRLLEAGLGEPLVLRWLDERGLTPAPPAAEDLVALKRAGASDELVAALLDRARGRTSPPVAAAPAPSPVPVAPPPAAPAAGGAVPLDVALRYIHQPDEGEPWNLVVYLDGTPFPPQVAAPSERSARTWTGSRELAPGRHVLRWAQERHRERAGERGPHAARFEPEPLVFELQPGEPAKLELEFRDRTGLIKRFGGPVDVRVAQGERVLAERHDRGDPLDWPLLCEDFEADLGDREPGFDARRILRECVRWAGLWKDVPAAPRREAVRPPLE